MKMEDRMPNEGGCWFCHKWDAWTLVAESEFDTNVHLECIVEALKAPDNEEAKIMSYLLKD